MYMCCLIVYTFTSIAVTFEFLHLLFTAWVEFSSGIVRSEKVVSNIYVIFILIRGLVKPMHFRGGTTCYWLKWNNDW